MKLRTGWTWVVKIAWVSRAIFQKTFDKNKGATFYNVIKHNNAFLKNGLFLADFNFEKYL